MKAWRVMKLMIVSAVAIGAFSLIAFSPDEGWSWCWNRDTGRIICSGGYQVDCCSGNPRIWLGSAMDYRLSLSTPSSYYPDIRAGFQLWTDVEMAGFIFREGDVTSEWQDKYDFINIVHINSTFCSEYPEYCFMGVKSFTQCYSSGAGTSSYHAIDCDIILNGQEYSWGDGSGGTLDTVAFIAHEAGHAAGLTHPGDTCRTAGAGCGPEFPAATMYYDVSNGGQPTDKRSLELDDIAAIIKGYPTSWFRVRVTGAAGRPVPGALVELIGTSVPVDGSNSAEGGRVYGDVSSPYLFGDKAASQTYVSETPFSLTDADGLTNFINPVHRSFSIKVTTGTVTRTEAVTVPNGFFTMDVKIMSSMPWLHLLLN